ncbi:ADP-ribose pyrophosphatase [Sarcoptes scabiei]|uniref:ADP-ribose pyrophosphatase, mitochondrial n=1 Tax=Sarcoptes scabiei TaxID=52283 RepID=A0A834R3F0_SARSC|nr:ADP-ribose pyrophosphatase [Sarcoptes scabiei]
MKNQKFYRIGNEIFTRFPVPDRMRSWQIEWNDYKPTPLPSKHLIDKPWADPELNASNFSPKWNQLDGEIDRTSHHGPYILNSTGFPLNPAGRTGVSGRGLLGRWGPNHAADPIVTRWKRDQHNQIVKNKQNNLPILQFVAIKRKDNQEWAIPGGMVDPGEHISQTLRREFLEESMNLKEMTENEQIQVRQKFEDFFQKGDLIYKGIVDDPRNTDNSWIETIAMNYHDDTFSTLSRIDLRAGDDAAAVCWQDIDQNLKLYANHINFIHIVAIKKSANW